MSIIVDNQNNNTFLPWVHCVLTKGKQCFQKEIWHVQKIKKKYQLPLDHALLVFLACTAGHYGVLVPVKIYELIIRWTNQYITDKTTWNLTSIVLSSYV